LGAFTLLFVIQTLDATLPSGRYNKVGRFKNQST